MAAGPGSFNVFSGPVTGIGGTGTAGRGGAFTGSFMAGGGDPAAEMSGQLKISGTNYQSTGIFAARK